jgi:anti-sigma factor RsiW
MKNMTDNRELLSALIDGEAVDADAIAAALEVVANRKLLVDFLRLRVSVQVDDENPPQWQVDRFVSTEEPRRPRTQRWLQTAAVLALLTAGGLGATWFERVLTRERPPEPARVVELQVIERQ